MTAALTPALALDYLHACPPTSAPRSCSTRAANASPAQPALAEPARAALTGDATLFEGAGAAGAVYAARDDRHAIVVVTGPLALAPADPSRPPYGARRAGRCQPH